jgi:hypothetical protein
MELDAATWGRINEVMPVYLCAGELTPKQRPERLVERFGERTAAELRPILEAITEEMFAIKVDWSQHTLSSGTDVALARIWFAYPQLSDTALKEMGRLFSWLWR